jgi:hypothetical protein
MQNHGNHFGYWIHEECEVKILSQAVQDNKTIENQICLCTPAQAYKSQSLILYSLMCFYMAVVITFVHSMI